MEPIDINFGREGDSVRQLLQLRGWDDLTIQIRRECNYLEHQSHRVDYHDVQRHSGGDYLCKSAWQVSSHAFDLFDSWVPAGVGKIRLERRLTISAGNAASTESVEGFQLQLSLELVPQTSGWQLFAPGMLYSNNQLGEEGLVTFSDHRLAYPVVMAYQQSTGRAICASRAKTAVFDNPPLRSSREQRYLQKTDIGAVGFRFKNCPTALHLFWPYYEGDRSNLLNARGSAASAYYPLEGVIDVSFEYEIFMFNADTFADAVLAAFKNAYFLAKPNPPRLPFSLQDSVEYRLSSLQKTYYEWEDGGAGFLLNFDPEKGYDSQAKAFGASFTAHNTRDSHSILEYGFTGRQLNAAYVLAEHLGADWLLRGRRIVDFFVKRFLTESGWMYTLYHLNKGRPIYTVGDPDGPVMHYLASSSQAGNYTRMMVEAAWDLLLNYHLQSGLDSPPNHWLGACVRFADFLVRCQAADGSWYRAYTPEGNPVRSGAWFGATDPEAKSATSIPIRYLLAVAQELGSRGEPYRVAATRAGEHALREQVTFDEYRGGTLDNPNVVDKEAALFAMSGLLSLYESSGHQVYLTGAERAAKLAITWNSIWNVPLLPNTRLGRASVGSVGWGGINSIWGTGVTDIYSLLFLADLVRVSKLTGEPLYENMAELIAHGTQQILSYPDDRYGFADIGMQPEGIAFCDQGADDGLINKGDIWGGLGWIYTAGTYGLSQYLRALRSS